MPRARVRLSKKRRPFREPPGQPLTRGFVIPSKPVDPRWLAAGGSSSPTTEDRPRRRSGCNPTTRGWLAGVQVGRMARKRKEEETWDEQNGKHKCHTSNSCRLPFSRILSTASSSLDVPNSFSSIDLDAPSSRPWAPCLLLPTPQSAHSSWYRYVSTS
jgi:hypothetical protein